MISLRARIRDWARNNPQEAGMLGLLLFAAIAWMVVQRVFAKPLGGFCKNDMDCGSLNCLQSVGFGYAGAGAAVCTKSCSSDSDCPMNFECKKIEVVLANAHQKVPADAPKQMRQLCIKR